MIELTDAELDQVAGGAPPSGGGVGTAFFAQGGDLNNPDRTLPVFNAFPGLSIAAGNSPRPEEQPPGHGQVTAGR